MPTTTTMTAAAVTAAPAIPAAKDVQNAAEQALAKRLTPAVPAATGWHTTTPPAPSAPIAAATPHITMTVAPTAMCHAKL